VEERESKEVFMDSLYLSVKEVATLLNKSEKWVYLSKESLPGYFKLAKSIFFDKQVLLGSLKGLGTNTKSRRA
jgi:predicted DNA-binding transcriptional regulator AlpA